MKHTPGTWTLEEHEDEPCRLIGNGTIRIADIFCTDFPAGAADAQLIAAAPAMLAALKAILGHTDAGSTIHGFASRAISQATGDDNV